jgi:hypothetical protein
MSVRLTKAAWLLLQRLNQETAMLAYCTDRRCNRYHFTLRGCAGDLVRESTLDALDSGGLLRRSGADAPAYAINDKGRQMLKERMTDVEFMEEIKA